MRRRIFVAAVAALALAPGAARAQAAVACVNCTNELAELLREAKRAAEFARHLAVVKENLEYQIRGWQALTNARSYWGVVSALGMLSNRYYPEAGGVVTLLRAGGGGAGSLLNSGGMRRLEQGFGNGAEWFEEMQMRQNTGSSIRSIAVAAMRGSQQSLVRIEQAAQGLNGQSGQANLAAAGNAIQLAQATTQHNQLQHGIVRSLIEEEYQEQQRRREAMQRVHSQRRAEELARTGSSQLGRIYN